MIGSALLIEEAFQNAGSQEGLFQNLIIDVDRVEAVIRSPEISAVTLTGSEKAGEAVAAQAGRALKKTVMELGGSNAFIVLEDADMEQAVETGVQARMQNNGQSCIAAKRFLVHEAVADEYIRRFKEQLEGFMAGDPMDEQTTIGPLARVDLAEKLEQQVDLSLRKGARLILGGERKGAFYSPTVLTNVHPGMPAFDEELFGPVATFTIVKSLEQAIELNNRSTFGLGATIMTRNTTRAQEAAKSIQDGAVFINTLVKSDPRLPFGGTKHSGYGRELGAHGIREFVNVKTMYMA